MTDIRKALSQCRVPHRIPNLAENWTQPECNPTITRSNTTMTKLNSPTRFLGLLFGQLNASRLPVLISFHAIPLSYLLHLGPFPAVFLRCQCRRELRRQVLSVGYIQLLWSFLQCGVLKLFQGKEKEDLHNHRFESAEDMDYHVEIPFQGDEQELGWFACHQVVRGLRIRITWQKVNGMMLAVVVRRVQGTNLCCLFRLRKHRRVRDEGLSITHRRKGSQGNSIHEVEILGYGNGQEVAAPIGTTSSLKQSSHAFGKTSFTYNLIICIAENRSNGNGWWLYYLPGYVKSEPGVVCRLVHVNQSPPFRNERRILRYVWQCREKGNVLVESLEYESMNIDGPSTYRGRVSSW